MTETITPPHDDPRGTDDYNFNDAATELILRYGPMILRDARRYSTCGDDAEDAYQRTLELLLTKAPSDNADELIPWLRTVARREAISVSRARKRLLGDPLDELAAVLVAGDDLPEEAAERTADGDLGAEALERLNPDQVECLLAQAQGHTYTEITALTGFSARKVTRCVSEGRRAFISQVAAIESGSECERIEPLLQRVADGDSIAHVEARPHLRNCPGCRATLRGYREAPARIAALFPLPLVAGGGTAGASVAALAENSGSFFSGLYERIFGHVQFVQQLAEHGTAKKIGALAGTVAALTAGGLAVDHLAGDGTSRGQAESAARAAVRRAAAAQAAQAENARPRAVDRSHRMTRRRSTERERPASGAPVTTRRAPDQTTPPAPLAGNGTSEFLPESR